MTTGSEKKTTVERQTDQATPSAPRVQSREGPPKGEYRELLLVDIRESAVQVREGKISMKQVADLMESIKAVGQTAAILVSPSEDEPGKHVLHAGHRRCAALNYLGMKTVKAIVLPPLDERDARRVVLADNLGREDLSAFEQAKALDEYCKVYEVTVEDAARELGIKKRQAFRLRSILSAPETLQFAVREHGISARAAELLVKLAVHNERKAVRLAKAFAEGKATMKGLQDQLDKAGNKTSRRAVAQKDVELNIEQGRVVLKLNLLDDARCDSQVLRVTTAFAKVLRHLGVARLEAASDSQSMGEVG